MKIKGGPHSDRRYPQAISHFIGPDFLTRAAQSDKYDAGSTVTDRFQDGVLLNIGDLPKLGGLGPGNDQGRELFLEAVLECFEHLWAATVQIDGELGLGGAIAQSEH